MTFWSPENLKKGVKKLADQMGRVTIELFSLQRHFVFYYRVKFPDHTLRPNCNKFQNGVPK